MLLDGTPAEAQPAAPAQGHFHPRGKAPSKFTQEVLRKAKASLPFGDTRDFEEQKRGLIAPMTELQIKNDAGEIAWDMKQFQFLDRQSEFDSILPSLHRIGQLNNNYGLFEVIPGIYQVRGFDLAQTTFVRGKTGWIVFDCLVTTEVMRAAWKLFQEHVGKGLPVTAVVYSPDSAELGRGEQERAIARRRRWQADLFGVDDPKWLRVSQLRATLEKAEEKDERQSGQHDRCDELAGRNRPRSCDRQTACRSQDFGAQPMPA